MNLGRAPPVIKIITDVKFTKRKKKIRTPNCSPVHEIVKLFAHYEGGGVLLRRNRCKDVSCALKYESANAPHSLPYNSIKLNNSELIK